MTPHSRMGTMAMPKTASTAIGSRLSVSLIDQNPGAKRSCSSRRRTRNSRTSQTTRASGTVAFKRQQHRPAYCFDTPAPSAP
jgi:hypothetical protein